MINRLKYLQEELARFDKDIYLERHRSKNKSQDIRKAIHFLELLLEIEYANDTSRR